jgi:hypothetical protein
MMGFLLRWLFALILLTVSFNPTDWNFVHWARLHWQSDMPLTLLMGLMLLVAYGIYLRATFRSIGTLGVVLVVALISTFGWFLWDRGVLSLENRTLNTWLTILGLSVVLGVGLSWSLVRKALTGQADVDEVEH